MLTWYEHRRISPTSYVWSDSLSRTLRVSTTSSGGARNPRGVIPKDRRLSLYTLQIQARSREDVSRDCDRVKKRRYVQDERIVFGGA